MAEADRGDEPQRLESRDVMRLRCFGEAVRAIETEAGLRWTASLEAVVSQEIEAAYSVMVATRTVFSPADFAVFFLGHLSEALPRRTDRKAARAGMMRYIVGHCDALGPDLAALSGEAVEALGEAGSGYPHGHAGGYASNGRNVSEAFLTAYGALRPTLTSGPHKRR